mgnify:CR=1 FL=1
MDINKTSFKELEIDQQITILGQGLIVIGSTFLSFGQILKLMKTDQLPTYPIQLPSTQEQKTYEPKQRSYFD